LVLDFGAAGMSFDLDAAVNPVRAVLETPNSGHWSLAVPICFEDAVPSVVRSMCVSGGKTDVDAIVNISNDGWFSDSDAARRVHAWAAAFRAIEFGRPLVRVANTGETAMFLPDGTTSSSLAARTSGTIHVPVPRYDHTTLQARWGNWLPRLCLALSVVLLALGFLKADRSVAG